MKRILFTAALCLGMSVSSFANPGHNRSRHDWVLPALIGGAILYEASRQNKSQPQAPVYQQPVYVQQPVYIQQQTVVIPAPPVHVQVPGFRWGNIFDHHCNCNRTVLIPQ